MKFKEIIKYILIISILSSPIILYNKSPILNYLFALKIKLEKG